jgi:hypothetical protein
MLILELADTAGLRWAQQTVTAHPGRWRVARPERGHVGDRGSAQAGGCGLPGTLPAVLFGSTVEAGDVP